MYSERFENRATVKAGELVKAGAIGRVVQTIGLGPHRIHPPDRPEWFWDKPRYGGILCDIGSHQADQFLYFTGSTRADVVVVTGGQRPSSRPPDVRGFRRRDAPRRQGDGLHPRGLVYAGRPGDVGRRPADDSRHGRIHRNPQEHRHRQAARARVTCSSSIRRKRATSTARTWPCRTARRSSLTC